MVEPSYNDHRLLICSKDQNDGKSYVTLADFSGIYTRLCHGYNRPGESDSDYEKFVPHSYLSGVCTIAVTQVSRDAPATFQESRRPRIASTQTSTLLSSPNTVALAQKKTGNATQDSPDRMILGSVYRSKTLTSRRKFLLTARVTTPNRKATAKSARLTVKLASTILR